jgi:hypothetical protein
MARSRSSATVTDTDTSPTRKRGAGKIADFPRWRVGLVWQNLWNGPYASTALGQYKNPLWTNRVGFCDWRNLFLHALQDVEIAGGRAQLPSMPPTAGGVVLEAEAATSRGLKQAAETRGYTGSGYLDCEEAAEGSRVQWSFEAPEAGTYLLELRYTLKWPAPSAPVLRLQAPATTVIRQSRAKSPRPSGLCCRRRRSIGDVLVYRVAVTTLYYSPCKWASARRARIFVAWLSRVVPDVFRAVWAS